jgi:pimeloyl-ACP methyl ester carboxylesterase
MSSVAEVLLRSVLGDAGWEGLPDPVKQIFVANGPAIVAEERGGLLDIRAEQLGTIAQPILLVAGKGSPPAFAEAMTLMAEAMTGATVEWVDGGHVINPAHPAVLAFIDGVLLDGR